MSPKNFVYAVTTSKPSLADIKMSATAATNKISPNSNSRNDGLRRTINTYTQKFQNTNFKYKNRKNNEEKSRRIKRK